MCKVRNIVKNRVFNFNHVFKVLTKQGISSRQYFAFDILAVAVLLSFGKFLLLSSLEMFAKYITWDFAAEPLENSVQ